MNARERLIRDLNLYPGDKYTQDWEYEAADYKRVREFLEFYKKADLNVEEKRSLIQIILESYEDYVCTVDFDSGYEAEIKQILEEDGRELREVINYWSCISEELGNSFYITPIVRAVRGEMIFRNYGWQDREGYLNFGESVEHLDSRKTGIDMHDNIIKSYNVDLEKRLLSIVTYDETKKCEKVIDISGVLTHDFEYVLDYNVVCSVEELPLEFFFINNAEKIANGKSYCWPIVYEQEEELNRYLLENKYKYIVLTSSYGMCGWILAQNMSWKEV